MKYDAKLKIYVNLQDFGSTQMRAATYKRFRCILFDFHIVKQIPLVRAFLVKRGSNISNPLPRKGKSLLLHTQQV